MKEQEKFWAEKYASEYIAKNSKFEESKAIEAWNAILHKTKNINSFLEIGSNIGRNIQSLDSVLPHAQKSIVEISQEAYSYVTSKYQIDKSFNGSVIDAKFQNEEFDLVFTMGVLIHINPNYLLNVMQKMYDFSSKYIIMGEYFNRTPVMIEYQGEKDKLFKRDFGKLFIENFDVKLVDYGFLWGHIYDSAGFDDITWWVFEKK